MFVRTCINGKQLPKVNLEYSISMNIPSFNLAKQKKRTSNPKLWTCVFKTMLNNILNIFITYACINNWAQLGVSKKC